MDEEQMQRQAAHLVSQMDQAQAAFAGIGTALGKLHQALVAHGVSRRVADDVTRITAAEWAAGTFGSS